MKTRSEGVIAKAVVVVVALVEEKDKNEVMEGKDVEHRQKD